MTTLTNRTGTASPAPTAAPPARRDRAARHVFAGLRIALGWVFLWAFLDKVFGLGYATPTKGAWIHGGHPTLGFLKNSAEGPLAGFYHSIAGTAWADTLFMAGLAGIGIALILGIGLRVAAVSGAALLVMMWSAVLPPASNPLLDDHLVYAGLLVALALTRAGDTWGLGRRWARVPLVARTPWLR